jgi:hypothetical protein
MYSSAGWLTPAMQGSHTPTVRRVLVVLRCNNFLLPLTKLFGATVVLWYKRADLKICQPGVHR